MTSSELKTTKIPGELVYNKTFVNGDSIYIEIRSKHGFVNGIVEYMDGNGVPIKFADYYVSANTTDVNERLSDDAGQNGIGEKDRSKRQSGIPPLDLFQGVPKAPHQRF